MPSPLSGRMSRVLIVMAGLPGGGKSTIAAAAARRLDCTVISVDPIEAAMWRAGIDREQPTGLAAYVVAEALAEEQLRLGHRVIVDAVNDVEPARRQWRDLAARAGVQVLFAEVVTTDAREHRRRLEERERGIPGFSEPTWESVDARRVGFDGWDEERLRLDFVLDPDVNAEAIVAAVERMPQRETFTTRTPGPGDAAALAELHVATWREAYGHLLPEDYFSDEHITGRHRMWDHVLQHPRDDVAVRVAEVDGEIIGFAWAGPAAGLDGEDPPRDHQLYAIYVAAPRHGSGAGQALLDDVLGDGPAMLWVATQNPRAIAFYLRNGFRFDGVEQVDPHAPRITDARMVR